jgi:hypothetical protein
MRNMGISTGPDISKLGWFTIIRMQEDVHRMKWPENMWHILARFGANIIDYI